jgi:adenylate cyclase class 2
VIKLVKAMHFEVELKFRVVHAGPIEAQLRSLGATVGEDVLQADLYFAHPARDFAVTDEALRIRRQGDHNAIAYKGPKIDSATKTRRELELPLPGGKESFAQFSELLAALGFSAVAEVRKRRRGASLPWRGAVIEAALDEVEGLGSFVELETIAEESNLEEAKTLVTSLAARLGLCDSERRSYLELLLDRQTD